VKQISLNKYQIDSKNCNLLSLPEQETLNQLLEITKKEHYVSSCLLPDSHFGYQVPIGTVIKFTNDAPFYPAFVGYDINCGIRFLSSNIQNVHKILIKELSKFIKLIESPLLFSEKEYYEILLKGGKSIPFFLEEEEPKGEETDIIVSQEATKRGRNQLGSLGRGNHFLEIQRIEKIFNKELAKKFNLKENCIGVMIHSGSRGFGHQITSDFIKNKIEMKYYYEAYKTAVNFGLVNRQLLTYLVRKVFYKIYNQKLTLLNDHSHNNIKTTKDFTIYRKGATEIIPNKPLFLPGSMGSHSYVIVGKPNEFTLNSLPHGAGRIISRNKTAKLFKDKKLSL